ncbi:ABC transporter ATP-binding protein [Candidatus Sordicultor fermentans]|uniref:ABC transporter ATP-binding protein n=1 Tax=Candidatus Sordicultor fermentans TaxID=1953203 RepID=UPI00169973D8|nr:ABC transporter ATP-binding protein [Candidatus Atribacteria bacterium]
MHNPGGGRHDAVYVVKPRDAKNTLKRLWWYLSEHKIRLFLVLFLVAITSVLTLVGPYLIGKAIDNYIIPRDFNGLFRLLILMAAIYVLMSLFTWLQSRTMINVAQLTIRNMRKDAFDKLQILPVSFFDARPRGDIMSRLTNDIDLINNALSSSLTQIFSSIITLIGTVILMLWLSPLLTGVSMITVPIMLITTNIVTRHTRRYFSEQQRVLGMLNGFAEENISGQKVVKAFVREAKEIERFEVTNQELKNVGIKAQIYSGIMGPLMNVLNNIGFAIVALSGGWLAVKQIITIGTIAAFINYTRQFTRPLNELANQINTIQSAIASAERLFEIMDEPPEPPDPPDAIELKSVKGDVEFRNVSFSYKSDEAVLKNISFHAHPGQTIALVGPTGAGKTSIINLLARFYDPDSGDIFIDGYNIQKITRKSLRSSLGIVLQDTYLFSESVKDNIRYGRLDATDEEVKAAARLANAEQFILNLPQGYDTILSEDGGDLSQGQRQLLAIARAILADPAILILDEATSSVDTRTEQHIQEAIYKLMKGRTSFVIAHRLSTIRKADMILVIDDGEIIERGNHVQLLKQKGFYYNLYMSQFAHILHKTEVYETPQLEFHKSYED